MKSTRPSMLILCPLLLLVAACGEGSVVTGDDGGEGTAGGDCRDGADNDADGLFDCDDDGCAASPDCEGIDENAAPSGAAIAIEPAAPGDDDDLTCTIVTEATDPNGDPVSYTFAWARSGADAGVSGATVGAALTTGGDTWTCTVTPNDGALDGAPASASVTIAQGNRAPSAPTVSISPAAPTDDDVLTCVIDTESVDPDGDTVTYAYAWSVDSADAGIASATVNASLTVSGQTWTCSVTASDGELESGAGTAAVTIGTACSLGEDACPASSCLEILEAGASVGDGTYWIAPDGDADTVFCDMTTEGGGWMLVGGVVRADGRHSWGTEAPWTDASTFGAASFEPTADFKTAYWGTVADDVMVQVEDGQRGVYESCLDDTSLPDRFSPTFAAESATYTCTASAPVSIAGCDDVLRFKTWQAGDEQGKSMLACLDSLSGSADTGVGIIWHNQFCSGQDFGCMPYQPDGTSFQDNDFVTLWIR